MKKLTRLTEKQLRVIEIALEDPTGYNVILDGEHLWGAWTQIYNKTKKVIDK